VSYARKSKGHGSFWKNPPGYIQQNPAYIPTIIFEKDLFTRAALLEITTSTSGVVSAGAVGAAGAALPLWLALFAAAAPRDARRRLDLPIFRRRGV